MRETAQIKEEFRGRMKIDGKINDVEKAMKTLLKNQFRNEMKER